MMKIILGFADQLIVVANNRIVRRARGLLAKKGFFSIHSCRMAKRAWRLE